MKQLKREKIEKNLDITFKLFYKKFSLLNRTCRKSDHFFMAFLQQLYTTKRNSTSKTP